MTPCWVGFGQLRDEQPQALESQRVMTLKLLSSSFGGQIFVGQLRGAGFLWGGFRERLSANLGVGLNNRPS